MEYIIIKESGIGSYDKGQTWGPFIHLQHDNIFHLYDESIWPEIASNTTSDGVFHLFYNADNLPGLYGDDDHEPIINRIIHNKMDFTVGVNELSKPYERDFYVSQNYPNPAVNVTNLILEVNKPSKISVEVINLTGQKVLEIPTKFFPVGNHNIRLNISTLTPGVYFYSINNGIENQTKKMIVK